MNTIYTSSSFGRTRQSGVTLIEILIAMLIGIFLVGGILQVFSSSKQTHRVHEATARMQETGRMAIEILARDIRMADFWGCASDVSSVVNNLDNGGGGYIDFGAGGVAGTEGAAGASDSLILRGGLGTGLALQPPYGPTTSSDLTVAAGNDLEQSDIVFISDCSSADIFQISNADPSTAGVVSHITGSGTAPGNYNATNPGCPGGNAHCLSKIYGADANLFEVQQITYAIGVGSEGEPALFRNGQEFLDGVEDLQILYGEDLDDNDVADYYVPANQVTDMELVVSIRFAIVARSQSDNLTGGVNQTYSILGATRTPADQRLRQTYTSTVNIRNRL